MQALTAGSVATPVACQCPSGFEYGLVVADALIKPDEHLAGFASDDGGLVVGPAKLRIASRSSKNVTDPAAAQPGAANEQSDPDDVSKRLLRRR